MPSWTFQGDALSFSDEELLRLTHALLRPQTALAAAEALRGVHGKAALEGLVELVYKPHTARSAQVAITLLQEHRAALVIDALTHALASPHSSVRLAAVEALHQRDVHHLDTVLGRILRGDDSWPVRREVVRVLADSPTEDRWQILAAATDPHWRVRHALIQVLLQRGQTSSQREKIDQRLAGLGATARVQGVREYLRYRWSGSEPQTFPTKDLVDSSQSAPFWDWDAAVLVRNLEDLGQAKRRQAVGLMPCLLGHPDNLVRGLAVEILRTWGQAPDFVQVIAQLDEPRTGCAEAVFKLLSHLTLDQVEAAARLILHLTVPSPVQLAWAADQAGEAFPPEEEQSLLVNLLHQVNRQPTVVRSALARLLARWSLPQSETFLAGFLEDLDPDVQIEALRALHNSKGSILDRTTLARLLSSPHPDLRAEAVQAVFDQEGDAGLIEALVADEDARVRVRLAECLVKRPDFEAGPLLARLQADAHPLVRAAALTRALAVELVKEPARETAWHVRGKAARLMQLPFWKLEPKQPWQPPRMPSVVPEQIQLSWPPPRQPRSLGPNKMLVSALGVSGHYGLPVAGFVRAVEAGVNLLFWEPNYQTLTEFAGRLPSSDRHVLHFITGTFEANGKRIRQDVERALRLLKLDRLSLFLLFWVQGWNRITPEMRDTLELLKDTGKIGHFGLSTHSRSLAVEALEAGWNPVMVRYSAAHRGAEEKVLPRALESGISIITFNNTCYARLLKPQGDEQPPPAADYYRYTLAHPAVTVCLSAPANLEQLDENLAALYDPTLPDERRQHLLRHGAAVYQEDSTFRKLVRSL